MRIPTVCALPKNPEDLTEGQAGTLGEIAPEDGGPWRAHNIRERFRNAFKSPDVATAEERLGAWYRARFSQLATEETSPASFQNVFNVKRPWF